MPKIEQKPIVSKNGTIAKTPITVCCGMPLQLYDRQSKLDWLEATLQDNPCDLFLTPQEWLGGHYIMKDDLHMERGWLVETIGAIARKYKRCLGVGACGKAGEGGATEDYYYFSSKGEMLGHHSKFALPSYDDCRTGGHGALWPETSFPRRAIPIVIPELRLRVGTVFCWEVFSQMLWPAYSIAGVNLVVHPVKFAPRGWLNNKKQADGKLHIVGFGYAAKSNIWLDRLIMAGRHQVMCPIAISCNSWDLGAKMMALVGHVDELKKTTELIDVPSIGSEERLHTFQMLPEFYEGLDHHHSAGAFVAHTGAIDGYSEMGEWTMTGKIRRLESQLMGGSTLVDCCLKSVSMGRQKKQNLKRALSSGAQKVKRTPST